MIGYYNYTVILTYLGTISGFWGITYIWSENTMMALVCLMISGFCDMFDGKIAATKKRTRQEKLFGIQIDSLSDLICFGVLPALIVYQCAGEGILHMILSALYLLCALIRLAWFNVDEEERQRQEDGSRSVYLGLPVTASALILPLFVGFFQAADLPVSQAAPWLLLCIAIAFLSPVHLKKPGRVGKGAILIAGMAGFVLVIMEVHV